MWSEFIWLRIGSSYTEGIFCPVKRLLASQAGLRSMELFKNEAPRLEHSRLRKFRLCFSISSFFRVLLLSLFLYLLSLSFLFIFSLYIFIFFFLRVSFLTFSFIFSFPLYLFVSLSSNHVHILNNCTVMEVGRQFNAPAVLNPCKRAPSIHWLVFTVCLHWRLLL